MGFQHSQIEIGNFRLFFLNPPPFGNFPQIFPFFLVMLGNWEFFPNFPVFFFSDGSPKKAQKNLGHQHFESKQYGNPKNIKVQKSLCPKIVGPQKFFGQTNLE